MFCKKTYYKLKYLLVIYYEGASACLGVPENIIMVYASACILGEKQLAELIGESICS
jgi:hypothetical protein